MEAFENGINDSAKGKLKKSIFGESIDKKGEIIVDLSFNEENTKIRIIFVTAINYKPTIT